MTISHKNIETISFTTRKDIPSFLQNEPLFGFRVSTFRNNIKK
jgi:hypothetical protein